MLILEWILDSGDTKYWKRTESWILDKDFRNQLSGYEKKCKFTCNSCFSSHRYPES